MNKGDVSARTGNAPDDRMAGLLSAFLILKEYMYFQDKLAPVSF